MAARRLLIIMLVLLGVSSLLAIALPNPERNNSTSQESATTGETGSTGATGKTGTANEGERANPDDRASEVAGETVEIGTRKPVEIEAKAGSRFILEVGSKTPSEVEIEGLGQLGFADRYAPAIFDLLLPETPGEYEVRSPGAKPSAVIVTTS